MILAIAYCHKDINQALRLMKWISFLSAKHGDSMKREQLLLVVNQMGSKFPEHEANAVEAQNTFGTVYQHIPAKQEEHGWPASANAMFAEALLWVERHMQDAMLWIEPDCVPVCPEWFERIQQEWAGVAMPANKTFMGARIPYAKPHLSGVSVYGQHWRNVAPDLITCPPQATFDIHASPQTLPNAHITKLFQQVWKPPQITTKLIAPETVLWHQDKTGQMIKLLDKERFMSELYQGQPDIIERKTMSETATRFFMARNASRRYEFNGTRIRFEPCSQVGGVWSGVFGTGDPAQIAILETMTGSVPGIMEITQEAFDGMTKKKAKVASLLKSSVLNLDNPLNPPSPVKAATKAEAPLTPPAVPKIDSIDSVIELTRIVPSQPVESPAFKPSRRGRRSEAMLI